jgi:cysteine desulfurase
MKIYLDANATSALRPCVLEMYGELKNTASLYANPSSIHEPGRRARARIRSSRDSILRFMGFNKGEAELIFTSGGTESCNLMILGLLGEERDFVKYPQHLICSSIEHLAVLETVRQLENIGWEVSWVNPNNQGIILVEDILSLVRGNTALISLMGANNETGIIQPILELAKRLRLSGYQGIIASDLVQLFGKSLISVASLFDAGIDIAAVSGHKIGVIPGIGALVLNKRADRCSRFYPRLLGGPQEKGFRAGTENIYGAMAFGAVCSELEDNLKEELFRIESLREELWERLAQLHTGGLFRITPKNKETISSIGNTLTVRFSGCRGDDLVVALDINGVAASTGSACSSGRQAVSHVIRAMELGDAESREVVRFSLDWDVSPDNIVSAVEIISRTVVEMQESMNT